VYNFVTHFKGGFLSGISVVLLGAGNSTRFELETKKQWLRFHHTPLWKAVADQFLALYPFEKVVVVGSENELGYMRNFSSEFLYVTGGDTRQASLANALTQVESAHVLVHDIARVCLDPQLIASIIAYKDQGDVVVPYITPSDTVVYGQQTIDRDEVKLIQTPQLSDTRVLKKALKSDQLFTDDRGAIEASGGRVVYVPGSTGSHKLTYRDDIAKLDCLKPPAADHFSGHGYDVHPFEEGKAMALCGVKIDVPYGFKAHSDGDVAIHALIDALLGAIGAGDIGELFPDSDERYLGIDSKKLLAHVVQFVRSVGYVIVNVDITILAQKPKLLPYKAQMRQVIAAILQIEPIFVNIKATTTEKLGFVGRSEGVAVHADANVKYYNYRNHSVHKSEQSPDLFS
jgi:2-C-methyl-D-erythritol 4-phosphate cytidylyltransferase/2-C-methyl-D-erythritol 2,4-cyclodiphosphate synthase